MCAVRLWNRKSTIEWWGGSDCVMSGGRAGGERAPETTTRCVLFRHRRLPFSMNAIVLRLTLTTAHTRARARAHTLDRIPDGLPRRRHTPAVVDMVICYVKKK